MALQEKPRIVLENRNKDLNPSFNDLLTQICNDSSIKRPTKGDIDFLKKMYDYNTIQGISVSRACFQEYSGVHFRQMIHRAKPFLEIAIPEKTPFYKIKGTYLDDSLTQNHTIPYENSIHPDFEKKLEECKRQPPHIHNIRVQARVSGLYEKLQAQYPPHRSNKMITISNILGNPRFSTIVNIHKNNLYLIISCSQNPIAYSPSGFIELSAHLGQVISFLTIRANSEFIYEPISNWVLTHYELNQDGFVIDSPLHHYRIVNLQEHSQFYLKKFQDGKIRPRLETKHSPKNTISDEATNLPAVFRKASEL